MSELSRQRLSSSFRDVSWWVVGVVGTGLKPVPWNTCWNNLAAQSLPWTPLLPDAGGEKTLPKAGCCWAAVGWSASVTGIAHWCLGEFEKDTEEWPSGSYKENRCSSGKLGAGGQGASTRVPRWQYRSWPSIRVNRRVQNAVLGATSKKTE